MKRLSIALAASLLAGPALAQEPAAPAPDGRAGAVVAAGAAFGVGFVVAGAVCAAYETAADAPCAVRGVGTSLDRLNALMAGEVDAAIVQSDWLMRAIRGDGLFAGDGPNGDLVALAGLHSEDFVLLAADADGLGPDALAGAPVDLGPETSYTGLLGSLLLDLAEVEVAPVETPAAGFDARLEALCAGDARAGAFLAAQPHAGLLAAARRCGLGAIAWPDGAVREAVDAYPGLVEVAVPDAFGAAAGSASVGLRYLLVARKDLDGDRARALSEALLAARPELAARVASWRRLRPDDLAEVGPVPLHPGARAAFAPDDGG